jgi:hypothetical protein
MDAPGYLGIASRCDAALREYGDTAKGAEWPNQADREVRFEVMLDLLRRDVSSRIELLDFACGTADLLRYMRSRNISHVDYRGADISEEALGLARQKFPDTRFTSIDVLRATDGEVAVLAADYCIIDGLFTVKHPLSDGEMWTFLTRVVSRLWPLMRKGIAFNVMSKHVDWERSDLFHLPYDQAAEFLHRLAGRNIAFRADYGLYEYTCFAFKQPWEARS